MAIALGRARKIPLLLEGSFPTGGAVKSRGDRGGAAFAMAFTAVMVAISLTFLRSNGREVDRTSRVFSKDAKPIGCGDRWGSVGRKPFFGPFGIRQEKGATRFDITTTSVGGTIVG